MPRLREGEGPSPEVEGFASRQRALWKEHPVEKLIGEKKSDIETGQDELQQLTVSCSLSIAGGKLK